MNPNLIPRAYYFQRERGEMHRWRVQMEDDVHNTIWHASKDGKEFTQLHVDSAECDDYSPQARELLQKSTLKDLNALVKTFPYLRSGETVISNPYCVKVVPPTDIEF